jgi:NADP-dependent 3-hydroxy acid dehydrogenase YdfG
MDSELDLQGRVALVTGASSGIGAATARRLAERGMHLVLGARRAGRVLSLATALQREHRVRTLAAALDVTRGDSVDAFLAAADAFAGAPGVHLLVNNAGLARGMARLPTATAADERAWDEMIATNVQGLLAVTRRVVPGMVARGGGHVVNIGSLAGIETYEGGSVYCATKAAVRIISKALRLELLGTGIRVCCINPGLVAETEFSLVRLGSQEASDAVYRGMTPLTGDDVARAIAWVAGLPARMNIEELNLQPTDQASAQKVFRRA